MSEIEFDELIELKNKFQFMLLVPQKAKHKSSSSILSRCKEAPMDMRHISRVVYVET